MENLDGKFGMHICSLYSCYALHKKVQSHLAVFKVTPMYKVALADGNQPIIKKFGRCAGKNRRTKSQNLTPICAKNKKNA